MAGLLTALGGAVAGIGQGLAQQAEEDGKARRKARLLELQHGYRMDEMGAQQRFQTGERTATQDFTTQRDTARFGQEKDMAGLNHGYRIGEIGASGANTQANTRLSSELQLQRDEKQHGYKIEEIDHTAEARESAKRSLGDTSGLSGDDQRQFKALSGLYGDDPDRLRQALAASGNPRLSALAQGGQGGGAAKPKRAEMSADDKRVYDAVIERYTDPMLKKTDWASVGRDLQAGGRDDLAAFAFGQPDPQAWQRLDVPKDLQPPSGSSSGSSSAARPPTVSAAPATTAPPSGKGTQTEPFQATTQADIEWFKSSAPKGAVIVVNGKPFTK
ncbi:hypothetical protein D3877_12050 [Azospirillum cavernae]|uniref:Uncharacterized protein n=1 Tax=Azospirillum cavernae TaxID=2320860 RepID=A0A418VV04_9PROT|nr:hypothetical protein [Azospirillum cavernae]RJF80959.1 hypothetical protein D3877_12050 [Azospirillum cavernae]